MCKLLTDIHEQVKQTIAENKGVGMTHAVIEKYLKTPGQNSPRKEDLCVDIQLIGAILADIFQYSLDTKQLPEIWKPANVIPIFKEGDRLLLSNYHSISLICKILEHIVLKHIINDLDKILVNNQHGFRKGLSCTTQSVINCVPCRE